MKIKYHSFTEQGKRNYNEDCVYPFLGSTAAPVPHLHIVCDGVGGSVAGNDASLLACQSFAEYFANHSQLPVTKEFLKQALKYTELAFDDFIKSNPNKEGMATTLTLVYVIDNRAIMAHIGDSRIYCFRNNAVSFESKDHSWAEEMLRIGALTKEEISINPKRNQILRAIRGSSERYHTSIEVNEIEIQEGDYFFLCSDGILESWEDDIYDLFKQNIKSIDDTLIIVKEECLENSSDNFTCTLLQVTEVAALKAKTETQNTAATAAEEAAATTKQPVAVVTPLPNAEPIPATEPAPTAEPPSNEIGNKPVPTEKEQPKTEDEKIQKNEPSAELPNPATKTIKKKKMGLVLVGLLGVLVAISGFVLYRSLTAAKHKPTPVATTDTSTFANTNIDVAGRAATLTVDTQKTVVVTPSGTKVEKNKNGGKPPVVKTAAATPKTPTGPVKP